MAKMIGGPFSIRAGGGFPSTIQGQSPIPTISPRLNEMERRKIAINLRRDGWSYHRIASTLDLRYAMVAAIFDGNASPATETASTFSTVTSRVSIADPRQNPLPHAPRNFGEMEEKLDKLMVAVSVQSEIIARLEASIPVTIETAHNTLFDRIFSNFKTLLGKKAKSTARSEETEL